MKDPGNPRLIDGVEPSSDVRPVDLLAGIAMVLRGACFLGVFILFCVGAYYTIIVFGRLGSLVADPRSAGESVDAIAEIIGADKLTFVAGPGDPVEPGRLVAFICLLLCYALWAYIPIQLIATCGKVLLYGLRRKNKKAPGDAKNDASR